jgi:hypothetical protein
MTPQDVQDEKDRAKAEKAYNAASSVKPNPKPAVKKAKGGMMKAYAKGGSVDGCAMRGKTKGRMV